VAISKFTVIALACLAILFSVTMSLYVKPQYILVLFIIGVLIFVISRIKEHRLLLITTCLLPFVFIPLEITHRYIPVTYAILALVLVVGLKYNVYQLRFNIMELLLLGLLVFSTLRIGIGLLAEHYPVGHSLDVWAKETSRIIAAFILYRIAKVEKLKPSIVKGLIVATIIMVIIQFYQTAIGLQALLNFGYTTPPFNYNTASGDMRAFSTFLSPVTYGGYLVMILSFLTWYTPKNKTANLFRIIVVLVSAVALIATETRSAWIAYAIAISVVYLLQRKVKLEKLIVCAIFLIPFVILFVLLFPQVITSLIERLSTVGNLQYSSNNIRLQLWSGTLEAMKSHLFAGYGQADFTTVLSNYIPRKIAEFAHPHQTYFVILFNYGYAGLFIYLSLFLTVVYSLIKKIKHKNMQSELKFSNGALAACLSFLVVSLFESFWGSFNTIITLFLLIGLGFKTNDTKTENESSK